MRRGAILAFTWLLVLGTGIAAAGEPARPSGAATTSPPSTSRRGPVLGAIIGAAGGFCLGLFIGLDKFDDAIDSDRKVWTTATVGAVGGAIAGVFVGKALTHTTAGTPGWRSAPALPEPPPLKLRAQPSRGPGIDRHFAALFAP